MMTTPELEKRIQIIEAKLDTILDHFHIGKQPAGLDSIERLADQIIRKKNTPGRGPNPPAGSSFVKGPRLIKKEGRE